MTDKDYYYYFAYGMNTNEEQMKIRCPSAIALGAATLPRHRFDFKTHATVTCNKRHTVDGVLWLITDKDELALDMLEGYPRYYLKKAVNVRYQNQIITAMTYYIPGHESLFPPYDSYYSLVSEGYRRFNVPTHQLVSAKKRAETQHTGWSWSNFLDRHDKWM